MCVFLSLWQSALFVFSQQAMFNEMLFLFRVFPWTVHPLVESPPRPGTVKQSVVLTVSHRDFLSQFPPRDA
jgi:hypothetical protein